MAEDIKTEELENQIPQEIGAEPVIESASIEDSTESLTEEQLPWDKDPRYKGDRATIKKVDELVANSEYDTLEDYILAAAADKEVREKLGGADIKSLLEAQEFKTKYEVWRAEQEILKENPDELPEERHARIEQALKDRMKNDQVKENERLEADKVERGWNRYDNDVETYVEGQKLDSDKEFVKFLLDRDGSVNSVDILDSKTTRVMTKDLSQALENYRTAIIKDHLEGKSAIPKMSSVQEPANSLTDEDTPKTIKEATAKLKRDLKAGKVTLDFD